MFPCDIHVSNFFFHVIVCVYSYIVVSESYDRVCGVTACQCFSLVWNHTDDNIKKPRNVYVATKDTKGSCFIRSLYLRYFNKEMENFCSMQFYCSKYDLFTVLRTYWQWFSSARRHSKGLTKVLFIARRGSEYILRSFQCKDHTIYFIH